MPRSTSSGLWSSSRSGSTTSPRARSTPCSRSGPAGTGRPWSASTRTSTSTRASSASWRHSSLPTRHRRPADFVLAYHYLTQGNNDAAVGQLKQVVALSPQDTLSAQLLKQFSPPAEATETRGTARPGTGAAPAKPGNLAGNWTAHPAGHDDRPALGDDGTFTWTVNSKGKPRQLTGNWSLADDLLTLAQAGEGGALVGRVAWQADDKWSFRVIGTGPKIKGYSSPAESGLIRIGRPRPGWDQEARLEWRKIHLGAAGSVVGRGSSAELADCTNFSGDNGADGTRLRIFLFTLKQRELNSY